MLYPMKMSPVFKQYIWGGNNIKKIYGKNTPLPPVAESWEISAHPDGISVVANGEYKGKTIEELKEILGGEFLGDSLKADEKFPLLLKILDAHDRLSVQVHPDDNFAQKHENGEKGKTEAWYILDAEEGARLIYGFKENVTAESFEKALKEGEPEKYLNFVPCAKGDVFYIPAGTVHAVGKGLLIAEIQQSSNTTYRVFDYNRRDKDGNLRPLHIDKALMVSNFDCTIGKEKTESRRVDENKEVFIDNDFFVFEKISFEKEYKTNTKNRLHMLFVAEGYAEIMGESFKAGDSLLIPAGLLEYTISGSGEILRYFVR